MNASTRRAGSSLLAATGVLHLVLAPEYLEEQAYVGVLFILGGLVAIALAVRLWRADDARSWALGGLIAICDRRYRQRVPVTAPSAAEAKTA